MFYSLNSALDNIKFGLFQRNRQMGHGVIESQLCAGHPDGKKDTCKQNKILYISCLFLRNRFNCVNILGQGDSGGPLQVRI